MSTILTWFLKEVSVTELLMCILTLDHITGPKYLILCFPWVVTYLFLFIQVITLVA